MSNTNDNKKNKENKGASQSQDTTQNAGGEGSGSSSKPKEVKPVTFVRRDVRNGIYSTDALGRRVKLEGRAAFVAKTGAHIDFCKNDPELIELGAFNKQYKKKVKK